MSSYNDSRLITLSSASADTVNNGTKLSSCVFSFPNMLQDEDDILYTTVSVQSAQIPISYYIINEYNNRLFYQIGTGAIAYVEFSIGNYNATSFLDEWKTKLSAITVVLSKTTGKFIFARNGSFKFIWLGSNCFNILGLDETQDYNVSVSPFNLAAPYPCQFQGITRIKVASSTLSTYGMDSRAGTYSNIMAAIPVNSGSYGILLYENTSSFKPLIREKLLNFFDIQLLDDDDNLINFNNIHWHLTLQMDITRKLNIKDRTFPNITANVPDIATHDIKPDDGQDALHGYAGGEPDIGVPLQDSTGDTDLDFLLFQNGILD